MFNSISNSIQISGNNITRIGNKLIIDGQEIDLNKSLILLSMAMLKI